MVRVRTTQLLPPGCASHRLPQPDLSVICPSYFLFPPFLLPDDKLKSISLLTNGSTKHGICIPTTMEQIQWRILKQRNHHIRDTTWPIGTFCAIALLRGNNRDMKTCLFAVRYCKG